MKCLPMCGFGRPAASLPKEKQPLDAGFFGMPERLLAELQKRGAESEMGRLKPTAERLAKAVDSVVVLGIGGSYMGAGAARSVVP